MAQLTRRGMLAGLAVLAARPSFALSANPDVVVVGAGAAGIGAARKLDETHRGRRKRYGFGLGARHTRGHCLFVYLSCNHSTSQHTSVWFS